MKKSEKVFSEIQKNRLIALLTPKNKTECLTAYEILNPHRITLEIAMRSEHALDGVKAIIDKYPEALVFAGTVMTRQQAEDAIAAGVAGVISADYIPEVVDVCVRNDVMCIPGGLSDVGKQLAQKADGYDCPFDELRQKHPYQWVYKLFPAFSGNLTQMDLAGSWRGPYKDIAVVYTGGITLDNIKEAARKDPKGIFCASALTKNIDDPKAMAADVEKWKEALKVLPSKPVLSAQRKPIDSTQIPKVVTFGEMLMRLSPHHGIRLLQTRSFDLNFGGAEANVAVALARFGFNTFFVTALPPNDLGDNACDTLKMHGVDNRFILRKGERMGIYYLEHGSGPRPSKVIYDRAHSSITKLVPEDIDWEQVLEKTRWFHWTGITPALGDSVVRVLRKGLEFAKDKGITVSVDLNYRKKLWSEEKARDVMTELMSFSDILIGNEEDSSLIFGIHPKGTDVTKGELDVEGYRELAEELVKRFGFKKVAITLRESLSTSENYWSACLYDGKNFLQSPRHHVWIIDRVGTGDAFAAGLIYSLLTDKSDHDALCFGVASACLKHSIHGDFNLLSVQEVERFLAGETSGRIQR